MRNKLIIGLTLLAVIFFTACNKDWLELDPIGKKLESNYYKTESEIYKGLMAAYDIIQVKYFAAWGSPYIVASLRSDDAEAVGGGTSDRTEYWEVSKFETTSTNPAILQQWRKGFYGIYRANVVLENAADIDENKQYRAEAKFLRAYFNFDLVLSYGDIPLLDHVLTTTEYIQARVPKSEVYALMEQDLIDAAEELPLKSTQSSYDITRASKGAAQAMLGKVYLFQGKYAEAAAVLKKVIDSGEYGLIENYDDIWKIGQEFGLESVFEVPYSPVRESNDWGNGRNNEGNIDVRLSGLRSASIPDVMYDGWGFDMLSLDLIAAYDAAGDEVRKNGTGYGEDYLLEHGLVKGDWDENENYTGWFNKKRANWWGTRSDNAVDWSSGTNERIIRYADVKLMYAEALVQSGAAGADEQVNDVRARVGLAPLSNVTLENIKLERRLELAKEGHRFYDLVRWGDATNKLAFKGFTSGRDEILPIPDSEITKSNGKLIQNPGYN